MKWPFSKSTKSEPQVTTTATVTPPRPIIITPPRPAAAPVTLKKTQIIPINEPPLPASSARTVPVALQSIYEQLPAGFLAPDARMADAMIEFPSELILPQLARGKVNVSLRELVPLLPSNLAVSSLPANADQHSITLPMNEVIAAIPSDAFSLINEAAADLSAPEYEDLPKLFDDSFLDEVQAAPEPEPQPEPVAAAPEPAPSLPEPEPAPAATTDGLPAQVYVKLRNLIAVMPEQLFTAPRAELWKTVDPNAQVALTTADILPMLTAGRVRLPQTTVTALMPADLVVPGAAKADENIIIPLDEIIRQLPPSVFTVSSRQPEMVEDESADISGDLFAEKTPAPEPVAEPAPVTPPAAAEEPAVEDEEFAVFAEKTEEPTPVITPEPIAEPVVPARSSNGTPLFDTAKFLGDLNRWSFDDLVKIEGVSRPLAKRIIDQRTGLTQFSSLEQVRQIPGINPKTFQALAGACPESLNKLLGVEHDRELSLQDVIRLTGQLPVAWTCI